MSKSYLTIKINNRRTHVCELSDHFEDDLAYEFLLKRSLGEKVTLLTVAQDANFSFINGSEFQQYTLANTKPYYEIEVAIDDLGTTHQEDHGGTNEQVSEIDTSNETNPEVVDLNFYLLSDRKKRERAEEDYGLDVDIQNGIKVYFDGVNSSKLETVRVNWFFGDQMYRSIIHICYSDPRKLVLDFGSEASQIGYTNENYADRIKIFDELLKMKKKKGERALDSSAYHQWDESPYLFKTNFPIKRVWTDFKPHAKPFDDESPVSFLSSNLGSGDEYFMMPNIKLLRDSGVDIHFDFKSKDTTKLIFTGDRSLEIKGDRGLSNRLNELRDGMTPASVIHRIILNHFFHISLHKFNSGKYVQFILLVPNIYPQERVSQIINEFYYDLKQMRNDYSEEYKDLKAEFTVIPEGVGPLTYILSNDARRKFGLKVSRGQKILLSDVGKGTTEISVIETGAERLRNITTIQSSGLPAAGNIINGHWWRQQYSNLSGYQVKTAEERQSSAKKIETEKVTSDEGIDGSEYMNCVARNYVKDFISILEEVHIETAELDKVILTGRGLLFDPLREALEDSLKEYIQTARSKYDSKNTNKTNGLLSFLKSKKRATKFTESVDDVVHSLGKSSEQEFTKSIAVLGPLNDFVIVNEGHDFVLGQVMVKKSSGELIPYKENILTDKGMTIDVESDDSVFIGTKYYEWDSKSQFKGRVRINLFYTGKGFISIEEGKPPEMLKLQKEDKGMDRWLGAALFPYNKDNDLDIRILDECEKYLKGSGVSPDQDAGKSEILDQDQDKKPDGLGWRIEFDPEDEDDNLNGDKDVEEGPDDFTK